MFSVIISEKGGAERRETFERTEINVGRVQGNELMLPKGNVSKRHARLLFRDGRFIVTDLKSTNGTYVNGRKIAQATIVREGDKIYIGDFVLRIEQVSSQGPPSPAASEDQAAATGEIIQPHKSGGSHPTLGGENFGSGSDSIPDGVVPPFQPAGLAMLPTAPPDSPSSASQSSAERQIARPSPRIEPKNDPGRDVISHFPLEHDPDDSVPYAVPGPPKVPNTPAPIQRVGASQPPGRTGDPSSSPYPSSGNVPTSKPKSSAPPRERPSSPGNTQQNAANFLQSVIPGPQTIAAPAPGGSSSSRRVMPPIVDRLERSHEAPPNPARRAALRGLVAVIWSDPSLAPGVAPDADHIGRIERTLSDRVVAMKSRGELPEGVDPETLVLDARRELIELGPLTPLLEDEDVVELQVMGHEFVVAVHGRKEVVVDVAFTSEHAVDAILKRLCASLQKPLGDGERFVERRLARGARLFAVRPMSTDQGHMIVVRKPHRADLGLEDLVRSGTISRAIAGLFAQCVAARANILVTGSIGAGATSLLGALAGAGSTDDRVVVLQEDDELIFNQPHTISILLGDDAEENARAVQAAARVRPDRLVVGAFAGIVAAELVDAMGDGVDGVLAAARAPTLRQAVPRLVADLAATRPGVPVDTAREWLASTFDLVIEISRLRDGRHRVLRVAELVAEGGAIVVRDIFTFSIERTAAGGSIEGTFHATGVVPAIVEDLAARGITIDSSIFKRSQR